MSTGIHMITQIRREDNIWEYILELPESLNKSAYTTYSFLAKGVRDYFQSGGFEPKGLPKDLNGEKFGFYSYKENERENYEKATRNKVKLPDGSYIECDNESIRVYVDTEEEAKKHEFYTCHYTENKFYYRDPSLVGGEFVKVPVKELMSYQEFIEDVYGDEWVEEEQDYGRYKVNFSCADYHTHSYLSLQELIDADKSDYYKTKVRINGTFWSKFKQLGGILPEGMDVIEQDNRVPADIIDAIRLAYNPDVIISWDGEEEEKKETYLYKGIEELKEIASKYDISDYNDIRIVFAFDN